MLVQAQSTQGATLLGLFKENTSEGRRCTTDLLLHSQRVTRSHQKEKVLVCCRSFHTPSHVTTGHCRTHCNEGSPTQGLQPASGRRDSTRHLQATTLPAHARKPQPLRLPGGVLVGSKNVSERAAICGRAPQYSLSTSSVSRRSTGPPSSATGQPRHAAQPGCALTAHSRTAGSSPATWQASGRPATPSAQASPPAPPGWPHAAAGAAHPWRP